MKKYRNIILNNGIRVRYRDILDMILKYWRDLIVHDKFELVSSFKPRGDQPKAIEQLVQKIERGDNHLTLLGATGTGKTFTISNVIEKVNRPTLVIAHNK